MKPYKHKRVLLLSLLLGIALLTTTCKKSIYVPPEGDTIQLQAVTLSILPGESVLITISGVKASGHPMPDNTLVSLLAGSGRFLDPAGNEISAVRLISGIAKTIYQSDENFTGESVVITARSGAALVNPEQLVIYIKSIDIAQLFMTANPLKLPPSGGTTTIVVTAYDNQQEVVSGQKIFLETTAGILTPPSPIITGSDGTVTAFLETVEPASVTATYKEISKTINIDVGVNEAPEAGFEFSPQNPVMGEIVYFTSTSIDSDGTIVSHYWDFGDYTTSKRENPTHQFPVTGESKEYRVILTVTDDSGNKSSTAQTVPVGVKEKFAPVADFTFSPQNPGIGETVQFTNLSSDEDGTIVQYNWNFGDGNTDTGQNPDHAYSVTAETTFTVTLTVIDDDGASAIVSKEITVTPH